MERTIAGPLETTALKMKLAVLNHVLKDHNIEIHNIFNHGKASESYVDVEFTQEDGFKWRGYIPFFYRRTGLMIESEDELSDYLISIKPYFFENKIKEWIEAEKQLWETDHKGKTVTKEFFDAMASLGWTSEFPPNDNPQRRIQDIKELGYTIASRNRGGAGRKLERLLVPIPRGANTGYETYSKSFRNRALNALSGTNVYELSTANRAGLIPDHKFPEIRWDEDTRAENPEEMPEIEIKQKFQLVDNQRNQQKREVCRQCFQTGKRGMVYGIKYFYKGDENWPDDVPRVGKEAEQGCVGCGWYDIQMWRDELNKKINPTPP